MKDSGLEGLVSKSLKYYREQKVLFGQKFPDAKSECSRRPADFWIVATKGIHHVECKQTTSTKNFYFDFVERLYKTGQYQRLLDFWTFSKLTNSWIILSFKNRKLEVDNYYVIHIYDMILIRRWIGKNSIRLDEIEEYVKFEYPKIKSKRYIDADFAKVRPDYSMLLEKFSVDGVKGKILKLHECFK
jgi:hypothetical protein